MRILEWSECDWCLICKHRPTIAIVHFQIPGLNKVFIVEMSYTSSNTAWQHVDCYLYLLALLSCSELLRLDSTDGDTTTSSLNFVNVIFKTVQQRIQVFVTQNLMSWPSCLIVLQLLLLSFRSFLFIFCHLISEATWFSHYISETVTVSFYMPR